MIELTNERWDKFYIAVSLIESLQSLMGGKTQVNLTTGRYMVCIESVDKVSKMVNDFLLVVNNA